MTIESESILHKVAQSPLIDNGDLLNAYRLVIASLHQGLQVKRAGIWFFKSDFTSISCQLLIDTFHNSEIEELILNANDYPFYFAALKSERTILADDAHIHKATSEFSQGYLEPLKITSMLDVPIRHKGKMIGIICCEHIGDKRKWTNDEAIFAASMADLVGRAINANSFRQSEDKLQRINDQLEQTITERTKQLVESEKMAALGNLVAGIAHEVNTPLGISITASSSLSEAILDIKKAMEQGLLSQSVFMSFLENSNELLFLLESNLARSAELVQTFKQTAVDHTDHSQHLFDIGESITFLIKTLQTEIKKHNVNIELDIENQFSIYSFPSAWSQIMTNLIINGCKHAFENTDKPVIKIKAYNQSGKIHLEYEDNGCGIPEENINSVIVPFYTTKRGQGGTGLGMTIVYNLVYEQLKGEMNILNNENSGLKIKIVCPLENIQ